MNDPSSSSILSTIAENLEKFFNYNTLKREKLYEAMADQKKIQVFESIPFLLGYNHESLPGFVADPGLPGGIIDYTPSRGALDFLSGFPGFVMPPPVKDPFVQMFALMGSGGTVAFTPQSDFDFWICYDGNQFGQQAVNIFKTKCHLIEKWLFSDYAIEAHFFLNEINRLKNNIFDNDDENVAGSAIGVLLKDEFLRSSILISGRIPFWWVTPWDADDATYRRWFDAAATSPLSEKFVDLGNLTRISPGVFLVAGIFQIMKSLGSPFKSIVKLGLLERYLHSADDNPFVSTLIKRNVHESRLGSADIDAYIIMFNFVYDYYRTTAPEGEELELLKQAFYLKIEPNLSGYFISGARAIKQEKTRVALDYITRWEWDQDMVRHMDNFQNWGIEPAHRLLSGAKKFVLKGYKNLLGRIESREMGHNFSSEQLQEISRKIYSHFLVSPNKIDNTLSFRSYPPEKLLHIVNIREKEGREYWVLSKRVIRDDRPAQIIINKHESLFGLCVWVCLNGLFLKNYTRLDITPGLHAIDANFWKELVTDISAHFMFKRIELQNSYFLREAFPVLSYIIVNPHARYAKEMKEFIVLYHNSWGETRFEEYTTVGDLFRAVVRILNGALISGRDFDAAVRIVASDPYARMPEFGHLKSIIKNAFSFFYGSDEGNELRYITRFKGNYCILYSYRMDELVRINAVQYDSEQKLLYSMSFNQATRKTVMIDPECAELGYLRTVIENSRDDVLRIYFFIAELRCDFFISDENGNIFYFRKPAPALFEYLASLHQFALYCSRTVGNSAAIDLRVEFYQIKKKENGEIVLNRIDPEGSMKIADARKKLLPLRIACEYDENRDILYRFTMPDGSWSNPYKKNNAAGIGDHFRRLMRSYPGYTYYPAAIDFSRLGIAQLSRFTAYSFTEKSRFELMVERELGAAKK